jgi:hypothetical protein
MKKLLIIISAIVLILLGIVIGIYYYVLSTGISPLPDPNQAVTNSCDDIGCIAGSIYAGSINSDKYYSCECRWAKNVVSANLICFKNDEDALADGRTKSEC